MKEGLATHTAIVAVKNEGTDVEFLKKVLSFLQHQSMHLRLLHVMEPALRIPGFYGDILGGLDLADRPRAPQEAEKHAARDHLESLRSYAPNPDSVDTMLIEHREPGDGILHEAVIEQAALIAIEVQDQIYRILPRGLSVALTLMQKADQPVLLLRRGSPNHFEEKYKTLVVSDDLGPRSFRAVQAAMHLAVAWKHTRVIHLHVVEERLHMLLQNMRKLGRVMDLVRDEEDLPTYVKKMAEAELKKRMLEFTYPLREAGCTYEPLVTLGQVAEEVNQVVEKNRPELVVYGRSKDGHMGGRVPFASMLEGHDAVLVVPGLDQ